MSLKITDSRNQKLDTKFKNAKNNLTSSLMGYLGATCVTLSSKPLTDISAKGMINASKYLSPAEKDSICLASIKTLDETGLSKKGVRIHDLSLVKEIGVPDEYKGQAAEMFKKTSIAHKAADGKNAFFSPLPLGKYGKENFKANEIIINMKKLPATIFHEMGHAFNYTSASSFWKNMFKIGRLSMPLATLFALYGAFTKNSEPKEENGGKLTFAQKTNNFIRNNAGKLAIASMIPTLLEEGMATVRGNGWAKKFLTPDLAKKVSKGNKVAYLSYIVSAAALGLAGFSATKIKDYILKKCEKRDLERTKCYAHQG